MNALTLAAILGLLLALGGSSAEIAKKSDADPKTQLEMAKDANSGGIFGLSGVNLNHNETLVREVPRGSASVGSCSPIVCGSNHNETLVRDRD